MGLLRLERYNLQLFFFKKDFFFCWVVYKHIIHMISAIFGTQNLRFFLKWWKKLK